MTYNVAQRTNEIGSRMAMGARPGDVVSLVVAHAMRLTAAGIGAGRHRGDARVRDSAIQRIGE